MSPCSIASTASRLAALGVGNVLVVGGRAPAGTHPFDALLAAAPLAAPVAVAADAPAVVLYTSGSTGKPKGVVHTHASLRHTARHQVVSQALDARDVQLAWMGIAYIAAFAGQLLTSLHVGGRLVLLPHFDGDAVVHAIARHGATRIQTGPADLRDLLDQPRPAPETLRDTALLHRRRRAHPRRAARALRRLGRPRRSPRRAA